MTKREYLYTVLMEECAEVTQASSKILRFGETGYCPQDEVMKYNADSLLEEYCHLTAAIEMLQQEGYLPTLDPLDALDKKVEKVKKVARYMENHLKEHGQ